MQKIEVQDKVTPGTMGKGSFTMCTAGRESNSIEWRMRHGDSNSDHGGTLLLLKATDIWEQAICHMLHSSQNLL